MTTQEGNIELQITTNNQQTQQTTNINISSNQSSRQPTPGYAKLVGDPEFKSTLQREESMRKLSCFRTLKHLALLLSFGVAVIVGIVYGNVFVILSNLFFVILQTFTLIPACHPYVFWYSQWIQWNQRGAFNHTNKDSCSRGCCCLYWHLILCKIFGKLAIVSVLILYIVYYNKADNYYFNNLYAANEPSFGFTGIIIMFGICIVLFVFINVTRIDYDRYSAYNINLIIGGYVAAFTAHDTCDEQGQWKPRQPIGVCQIFFTLSFVICYIVFIIMVVIQVKAIQNYINN